MRILVYAAILLTTLTAVGCVSPPRPKSIELAKIEKTGKFDTLYDNIIIEVQAVEGMEPDRSTFTILAELFEQYQFCKKENVMVVYKYPVEFPCTVWPNSLVHQFEDLFRAVIDQDRNDRSFSVFVSYLPGIYGEHNMKTVAGLKYGWSSIAVFGKYSGKPGATLLLHEFGHLADMVDRSKRKEPPVNPDRKNHCNNKKCVMFWQWNKKNGFCGKCRRDVKDFLELRNKLAEKKKIHGPL